jgi:hypothetical protein
MFALDTSLLAGADRDGALFAAPSSEVFRHCDTPKAVFVKSNITRLSNVHRSHAPSGIHYSFQKMPAHPARVKPVN